MPGLEMFYIVVIVSVLVASCAQMLLKKGASLSYTSFLKEYLNPWVICGYTLMGFSLVVNVYAMSKGIQVKEVSIIESLSYLFVPLFSFFFFQEHITRRKVLSIFVILMGIAVFFYE